MTYTKITLIAFIALFPLFSNAQSSKLIGKPAPDIVFKEVLNDSKTSYKLSDFKGKAVIIDFWSTSCRPCIESFPKLEKWQKDYQKDLKIITIAQDKKARIIKFLQNRKLALPVVLDTNDQQYVRYFPHKAVPHTIFIDKSGMVQSITTAGLVTEKHIKELIAGKKVTAQFSDGVEKEIENLIGSEQGETDVQMVQKPFDKNAYSVYKSFKNGRLTFINMSYSTIYEILYNYPNRTRTRWENPKSYYRGWGAPDQAIGLEIYAPKFNKEQASNAILGYLSGIAPVKVKFEEREIEVKVLTKLSDTVKMEVAKSDDTPSVSTSANGIEMKSGGIENLASFLEDNLSKPIIDETGLTKKYNLSIPWYPEKPNACMEELEKIGLTLTDGKRKVKLMILVADK
ncbi:redoxin domain-containing protein [Flectobacillus sp. DC10W]|uniref:Redoxin domain-containing protein n=1 Tax=Flectobacillus longus TaxID=2984207 RepID=A0ABT6YHF2_9BACT|nr:redoxin domain-containing protein [Flectobacillus longus]MDI9862857.1 redoxin domain-containing protein [Flectobacillus longus]